MEEIVYLNTNKENIETGKEVELSVNLRNQSTAAFNFTIYFDNSKLDVISESENMNVIENKIIYVWHDKSGGSQAKEGEIAKFKFKSKNSGTANFNLIGEFYDENRNLIENKTKDISIEIIKNIYENNNEADSIKSQGAKLEVLAIENVLLYPVFEPNQTNYTAEIPNKIENINIFTAPEDENASVEILGGDNLKEGENLITIIVTAANGIEKQKYEVKLYKRNSNEEVIYEQKVEENKENLEKAYTIQKLNSENNEEVKYVEAEKNNNVINMIVIVIISGLIVFLLAYIAHLNKKRKRT